MDEKTAKEELKSEIDRGNFERAAYLASGLRLSQEEIQDFQKKALWQMAAEYRNAIGTKKLAQEYGLSKESLRELLEKKTDELRREENVKSLKSCYDYRTGKHLSFEEWMENFFKNWNSLPDS